MILLKSLERPAWVEYAERLAEEVRVDEAAVDCEDAHEHDDVPPAKEHHRNL